MLYTVTIDGITPIIHHSAQGLDPLLAINNERAEITRKKGSNRTESDDARLRELDTIGSLWLDGRNALPSRRPAIRGCIETGARKLKQGPQVREGMTIDSVGAFDYDVEKYGATLETLQHSTQFTVPVVVQRSRILRTRAKFDPTLGLHLCPRLRRRADRRGEVGAWLDIAGRRIGLGDWRPEKSGTYGRFKVKSITPLDD